MSVVPTSAVAVGIALTLAAGTWQLNRAAEKERRQERLEAQRRGPPVSLAAALVAESDLLYRRVRISGRFEADRTLFLDNRVHGGVTGFEVLTPMRIGDSSKHVLVNRGWTAGTRRRDALPAVRTPANRIDVEGTVVPAQRVYELSGSNGDGKVWLAVDIERMRDATGLDLQPILVQQESETDDGLVRDWPRPDTGRARHLAYAFQWFALSVAILVIYVVLGVRRSPGAQQSS